MEFALRNDLHFAVKNEELFLEYQGIYSNSEKKITGLEALVRWNHSKYGVIMPNQFIHHAEKDSLIYDVDLWVLRKVVSDLTVFMNSGKDFYINVNISPKNFMYPSFIDEIEEIMKNTCFPENSIVFELTESSSLNIDILTIQRLKFMGIRVVLDDFGTGFASLSQLKTLDIDAIKIDISFIKEINKDMNSTLITLAILNMAKSLEIGVIAEGIETEEQLKFLIKNNCANMQGFFVHRPERIEYIMEREDFEVGVRDINVFKRKNFSEKMTYSDDYKFGDLIYQNIDSNGFIKDPNERFSAYLGYQTDEIQDRRFETFLEYDYKKSFLDKIVGEDTETEPLFLDKFFRMTGKNNLKKYVLLSAKKDSFDGDLIHIFLEDISEHVDFGENIQRIKMGYRRIFEESPVSVIILDESLGILDLNRKAEETFGWKKQDIIGNYVLRHIVKSKDFHEYKEIMDNVLQGNDSELLSENITCTGKTILCKWYNRPVKNSEGEVKLIISMIQDVTADTNNEKHLKMLESAVEQSTGAMIITNINGVVEYVNKKYIEISGFKSDEVVGKHVREMRTDSQDKNIFIELWDKLNSSQEWNGEINYLKKNGESFWTKTKIFPAFDGEGNKINYISINDDITEERKVSEKFNRINRTLIDQEKMASIGQMAAGIVHEINNPLSYISTNIFSLKDMISEETFVMSDEFLEDLKDILDDLEVGVNNIKQIASSLKKFSFRNVKEEKQLVNLNEEIRNTLIVSKNEYKYYANISFEDEGDIYVYGYSGQLRQVFLNMIINSVYAIRKKFENEMGLISISIYENLDFAYIKFSDNGTGIKDENKNKIFEPFFTTKAEGEGTGLGLNITWDIIKNNHNGDIFVDGNYGEGAIFIIRIPKENESEE